MQYYKTNSIFEYLDSSNTFDYKITFIFILRIGKVTFLSPCFGDFAQWSKYSPIAQEITASLPTQFKHLCA
jgi:hypothetical protein